MSEEDDTCPLCIEEIDITDRYFKPCPCGYRICRFCWTNLIEQYDPHCPACRRPYSVHDTQYQPVPPEELEKYRSERKKRSREKKEQGLKGQGAKEQNLRGHNTKEQGTKQLKSPTGTRVVQKNALYVTGLPPSIINIDTLRSHEYFGQFGKNPNSGIYVFFVRKEDAARALEQLDECHWSSDVVRVTYATTKYCTSFLKKQQCRTPGCIYLHRQGEDPDVVLKEELSPQLKEKTRKLLSPLFPIVDANESSRVSPGGRILAQKPITTQQQSALSESLVRLPRPIVNKKRISPPEISITKKPAQPEITAPPDRQTPEAAYVSQTTPAAQKTTKVIGITKISKQRMQTIQLAEDQSNKPPVQQRSMKANSVKSSQTKQQDDSLSTGSFRAYSPVQSSAKNQPGQQGHVKVQTYAKTFRDPPGKTNRLRTSPKTFQSTQKHADNSPGMSWLPSLEAEAVSMIKPPGSAGYSTFASAVTRRFNTQEKVAHHSMAQDRTRDVRRIVDKKHVPKKTASTNAPPPPAPESTKHSPEPLQLSSNIQSDRDDTAESRSAIAYQDSCNGIGTQSALSSSNEAEKVRGDTQPSVEERSEGFRSANSNFNTSALHESEAENDDLDLVRSSAHPIYTGIMDPFSDDILSMLSSAIVLQGVADQFSDDIVYYPSRGDSQNKPRYPNAGHKDAFLNAQRQQQNMEDPLQQRTGMQPMGAQCIDLAARNPATLSGQGGSQNRYLHVFNNVPHRTTNTHHEHEAPPITKDNLYKRTRDDYKGSVQGPQYPPVAPPVAGIRNEYEHDASQSLRTEYHKLQGSMDYQDVYFVDPWAQHVARQNATVHHPADSFTQTLRRYPPPKKQTYPGDSALERGMEQTLQQPRQGEFHPQYSGRTYQDLFTMRSHAPHPGTESNPAQSSHKQYAPVDVQHQGETPFTKTNIHFKDPQRLLAAHTIPSQFCGLQIQEQPRQHSMAVDSRDTFAPRSDVPKTHYKVKGDFANAPRVLLQSSPEVQGYENTNRGQMRCDNQDSRAAACIPEWHSGPHRIPTGSLLKPPRPSGDAPI